MIVSATNLYLPFVNFNPNKLKNLDFLNFTMLVLKQDKEFEGKLKIETELVDPINVNINKLNESIKKAKGTIVVLGGNERINRKALENKKVSILLNVENNIKEDSLHYRRSGLNQVLCKLANENNISIGFDFCSLLRTSGKERAKILGRMLFNYKLCKKYKVKMIFSCFAKDKFELRNNDCLRVFERILERYSKNL